MKLVPLKLRICNFGPYVGIHEIDFGYRTIISGPNDTGKTSIGNCICWSLYGCLMDGSQPKLDLVFNTSSILGLTTVGPEYQGMYESWLAQNKDLEDTDERERIVKFRGAYNLTVGTPECWVDLVFNTSSGDHTLRRDIKFGTWKTTLTLDGSVVNGKDLEALLPSKTNFLCAFNPNYFISFGSTDAKKTLTAICDKFNPQEVFPTFCTEHGLDAEQSRQLLSNLDDMSSLAAGFRKSIKDREAALERTKTLLNKAGQDLGRVVPDTEYLKTGVDQWSTKVTEYNVALAKLQQEDRGADLKRRIAELTNELVAIRNNSDIEDIDSLVKELDSHVDAKPQNNPGKEVVIIGLDKCPKCGEDLTHLATSDRPYQTRMREWEQTRNALDVRISQAQAKIARSNEIRSTLDILNNELKDTTGEDSSKARDAIAKKLAQAQGYLDKFQTKYAEAKAIATLVEDATNEVSRYTEDLEKGQKDLAGLQKMAEASSKWTPYYLTKLADGLFANLEDVDIQLFSTTRTGEVKPAFVVTYKGAPSEMLSHSARIKAGMELAVMMRKASSWNTLPIFIDDAEALSEVPPMLIKMQHILAYVDDNVLIETQGDPIKGIQPATKKAKKKAAK